MKSPSLPTILVAGIFSLTFASQQASAAVAAFNPNGIYGSGTVLTIGAADILDISGYAKTVGLVSMQDTVANTAVITAGNAAVALAARNGIIWMAGGVDEAAKDAAQLANIAYAYAALTTGFNGGAWDGFGINSGVVAADANINGALAVILYDNTQLGYTQWSGFALADPNARQVLMRASYAGDLTGDGTITPDDYFALNGYLANSLVAQGDLNFDGLLGPDDYFVVNGGLANIGVYGPLGDNQSFAGFAPTSMAVAPEPTSGLLLMLGTACLASVRKRKQNA